MKRTLLVLASVLCAAPGFTAPELLYRGGIAFDLRALGGDNDRAIEPGESFDLVVTLGNEGDIGARAIVATLISTDPMLTVAAVPASVAFPDIPKDGFGTGAAPHFRLTAQPAIPCGKAVTLNLALNYTDDLGAPFSAVVPFVLLAGEITELAREDFDTGPGGWTRGLSSTGTGGQWVNAAPEPYDVGSEPAEPGRDVTYPDVSCFYTGQDTDNVDGGTQVLRSRTYDLSGRSNVWLTWFRWFFTDDLAAADSLELRISTDGGLGWTTVERITTKANAWIPVAYRIDTLVTLSNNVLIEVVAEDAGADSTVEAAVDELFLLALACGIDPPAARLDTASPVIDDSVDVLCSDRDGNPDAGETFDFSVTVTNVGTDPGVNSLATLVTPLPPELTLVGANPQILGTIGDNGGTAVATFRLKAATTIACKSASSLSVTVSADPPALGSTRLFPLILEEDVNQPTLRWFDDFDSGLADWTVFIYGLNDDWGAGVQTENCAKTPGTPPTPALKFWFSGQTGVPTDCSVTSYGTDDDSAIRTPRIDTGYVKPYLLDLKWNQLLTMTPGDADFAEVWIDHDDNGTFTRIAQYAGQVTTNGDTLDLAAIDLQNNPDSVDLSATSRFITLEMRFRSDSSDGNSLGKPLGLGWIVDNVELTWTDANGRTCDANVCSSCQSNPNIVPSKTQACVSEAVTLDGSGSSVAGCPAPGVPVYDWYRDGLPYASGVSSIVVSEPLAGSYDFRLDVSCSTLIGCRASSPIQKLIVIDCPNCSANAILAPAATEECAGTPVTLDPAGSSVSNCPAPGVIQYRWFRNGLPAGPGPIYTANEPVAGTYDYLLEVSCTTDVACKSQITHSIVFKPDGMPVSTGNTLRARKAINDVALTWTDTQLLAVGWKVFRRTGKTLAPVEVAAPLTTMWTDPLALPSPPLHYLYDTRAVSCSGLVGP